MPTDPTVRNARVTSVTWQSESSALKAIRTAVFIEEQGVPVADEWDQLDAISWHYLAFNAEDQPIGCGRLTPQGQISRMAVLQPYRGQGVGQALMAAILEFSRPNFARLHLHAQLPAIGFYEQFGFTGIGPIFEDAGIAHRAMELSGSKANPGISADRPPTALIRDPELMIDEVSEADFNSAVAELGGAQPESKPSTPGVSSHIEYFIATTEKGVQGATKLVDGAVIEALRLRAGATDEVALALIDAAKSKAIRYQNDRLRLNDPSFSEKTAARIGFESVAGSLSLALALTSEHINRLDLNAAPTQTNLQDLSDPKARRTIRGFSDSVTSIEALVQHAKARIRLWTPGIDPDLYSRAELIERFKNLALKNKHTRIEILLSDSRSLVERGHLLLELSRRLPASIQIKRAAPEHAAALEEVLLIDERAIYFRPSYQEYRGWACLDDILTARRLHEQYKVAWQHALEDPQLRVLKL